MVNRVPWRHVIKVKEVTASVECNCSSKVEQFVRLFRQISDIVCVNAVATNDHFVMTFSSHLADVDANVDIVAVSTVYQVVVDIVLNTRTQTAQQCSGMAWQ